MLPAERHQQIVEIVNKAGVVSVEELCEKLDSSPATIRRDLQKLSLAGRIIKTHGGAVSISTGISIEPPFTYRKLQHADEKQRIAKRAVDFIRPGETIILDAGTTTFWMAEHLQKIENLNVWTNDLNIAWELKNFENIELTMIGGKIRKKFFNSVGSLTNQLLKSIHVDQLFIAVDAIDVESGLMVYSPEEAELKRLMIETTREVTVVCDRSKFEKMALVTICPITSVQRIITTQETDPSAIQDLQELNIKVEIV